MTKEQERLSEEAIARKRLYDAEYIKAINADIDQKMNMSKLAIENDYFAYLKKNLDKIKSQQMDLKCADFSCENPLNNKTKTNNNVTTTTTTKKKVTTTTTTTTTTKVTSKSSGTTSTSVKSSTTTTSKKSSTTTTEKKKEDETNE